MLLYHATIYRFTQTILFTEYWCIESIKPIRKGDDKWLYVQTSKTVNF